MAKGNPWHTKNQKVGDWTAICDRSGFRGHASRMVQTWDGFFVLKEWDEARTPQDFVRSVMDQKPLPPSMVRPDVEDREFVNGTNTEADLIAKLLGRM